MASCSSTARARTSPTPARWQQQRADRPYQRFRHFLSGERRNGRADRQFERHRQRHGGARRAQHRRLRGHQPDDRREADQQQHQRQRRLDVGNTGITSADTLTVNGTGGLSNTGEINIEGSATVQATLNVANAAAGFGTAGVETGTVFLENDALLEFKSGEITTINGGL